MAIDRQDARFQKWVHSVSPNASTEGKVLVSSAVPWVEIVNILIGIFQALLAMGCFAAARTTSKVKTAMKDTNLAVVAGNLSAILAQIEAKGKK